MGRIPGDMNGRVAAGLGQGHRRIWIPRYPSDIDRIVPLQEGKDRVGAVAVGVLQLRGVGRSDVVEVELIVAGSARDHVVTAAGVDDVGAGGADDGVVSGVAVDGAGVVEDEVIARAQVQFEGRVLERVAVVRADDLRGAHDGIPECVSGRARRSGDSDAGRGVGIRQGLVRVHPDRVGAGAAVNDRAGISSRRVDGVVAGPAPDYDVRCGIRSEDDRVVAIVAVDVSRAGSRRRRPGDEYLVVARTAVDRADP